MTALLIVAMLLVVAGLGVVALLLSKRSPAVPKDPDERKPVDLLAMQYRWRLYGVAIVTVIFLVGVLISEIVRK